MMRQDALLRRNKLLMRLAIALHGKTRRTTPSVIELPTAAWRQCEELHRQLRKAHGRGWRLATRRIRRELQCVMRRLQGEWLTIGAKLEPQRDKSGVVSIRDIYADLVALHDEFDEVSIDWKQRTISVTTDAIELDSVYLGPFEIRLDWGKLNENHSTHYRVIAREPHPADSDETVTHPHVKDEDVCEGDARQPISSALEQGCLFDFFVIVANLLRTYNPGSPFVALVDWRGEKCSDCGAMICYDESRTCDKCETTLCPECTWPCAACDSTFCNECVAGCQGCEEHFCAHCLKRCQECEESRCSHCLASCQDCGGQFCSDCFDEERCANCHEDQTTETNESGAGGEEADESSGPAVHADGVGEAAVST